MQGIVSKSTGSWYKVIVNGEEVEARLRGIIRKKELKSTNPVVVGDYVELEVDNEEYFIKDLVDRNNCIVRKSHKLSKQYQVIAANLDLALLVVSPADPYTPQGFIDRFLVNAEAYQIPVVIIINKSDIDTKKANAHRDYLLELYQSIDYDIRNVSFLDANDVAEVQKIIFNKTVLISGNSGVGKSTLINAIDPDFNQKTGAISKSYNKGKHTTTFAQMFVLKDGTRLIDTPGIKDFGLVNMDKHQICHFFPEMKKILPNCKFSNCLHVEEPSCAVVTALENDELNVNRYVNYLGIIGDL